ncbi:UDP-N-acetylmuramate dehydrogenase [Thalassotalea agariperforans]
MNKLPMITASVVSKLHSLCPNIKQNISLASISRWKVGGLAKCIVSPENETQICNLIQYLSAEKLPYIVIGSTTNLLFSDQGLNVIAIQLGNHMAHYRIEENNVWCQSGIWVPGFARIVAKHNLTGIEHTCGIPGTLGGLICMNGGSQRKGIGKHVISVRTVTPNGEIKQYTHDECQFSYRSSIFQHGGEIIVSANFKFQNGHYSKIRKEMLEILGSRRKKFPQKYPNCGSVFVSNPAMYADYGPPGAVIEQCGLKGTIRGGACISPLHANFIVNQNNATADDILYLIHLARTSVLQKTGYDMPAEAHFISESGQIIPAHIKADEVWGNSFND